MNIARSEQEKQELETLWLRYMKRKKENVDADGWFLKEHIQDPLNDVINRLEPIIMEEFFTSNITCINAYREKDADSNTYILKKENDHRIYRLVYDPAMDMEEGLYYDIAESDETFCCFNGEVYDLVHKLERENIIEL